MKTKELEKVKISIEKSENKLVGLNNDLSAHEKNRMDTEKSIGLRRRHLERLKEKFDRLKFNIQRIHDRQELEERINSTIEEKTCNKEVDVMDIVKQQKRIYDLHLLIKTWTRKVEIAQLAKKSKQKAKAKS